MAGRREAGGICGRSPADVTCMPIPERFVPSIVKGTDGCWFLQAKNLTRGGSDRFGVGLMNDHLFQRDDSTAEDNQALLIDL